MGELTQDRDIHREHVGGGDPENLPKAQHGAVIPNSDDDLRWWRRQLLREAAYDVELVQADSLPFSECHCIFNASSPLRSPTERPILCRCTKCRGCATPP